MGKVYASSDWHGCGAPAQKLIDYLKPDDTLYFLGDAIDRGPDSIKLLDWLFTDPRVKMLKGNHEDFMEKCVPLLIDDDNYCHDSDIDLWLYDNHGMQTFEYLVNNKTNEEIMEYIDKIKKLPLRLVYDSPLGHKVIMEHAGFTPGDIPHRSHDSLWDREHFYDNWNLDYEKYNNIYLVHGHTPVQYLKFYYGYKGEPKKTKEEILNYKNWIIDKNSLIMKAIRYCHNHKFDIDMCTISTNRTMLLDLDTFEEIYFDVQEENKNE